MNFWRIIIGCWIVVGICWIVAAFFAKRTTERQSIWREIAYRLPIIAGAILLSARRGPLRWQLLPASPLFGALGAGLCILGLAVAIWARITLAGNWSSNVTFKKDHQLVQQGPYHFVRHPIYTGLLLMCGGTAVAVGRLAGFVCVFLVAVSFWIKLNQEEELMMRHFPAEYPAYRARVKALIPGVF